MAYETFDVFENSALPGLSLFIPDGTGALADLTGYTGKIWFVHPSDPSNLLVEWTTVTVAGTGTSNFDVTDWGATPPWTSIVTAWGSTLPVHGEVFWALPQVTSAAGRPWPFLDKAPRIAYRIHPTPA